MTGRVKAPGTAAEPGHARRRTHRAGAAGAALLLGAGAAVGCTAEGTPGGTRAAPDEVSRAPQRLPDYRPSYIPPP
ncbi:protein-disulfide isomerase, partial [Streptomyces sp. SB3404]|nr:protein-disulfide isomerase [Streptomyces boncukensis]